MASEEPSDRLKGCWKAAARNRLVTLTQRGCADCPRRPGSQTIGQFFPRASKGAVQRRNHEPQLTADMTYTTLKARTELVKALGDSGELHSNQFAALALP
jgi:hypothetical protein